MESPAGIALAIVKRKFHQLIIIVAHLRAHVQMALLVLLAQQDRPFFSGGYRPAGSLQNIFKQGTQFKCAGESLSHRRQRLELIETSVRLIEQPGIFDGDCHLGGEHFK